MAGVEAHPHAQRVQAAELALDRVHVDQCLRGVLVGAVAAVDQRHGAHFRRAPGDAGRLVAQDDQVRVAAHHADRVLDRLALRQRGGLHAAVGDHRRAEARGGGAEAENRARGGLEEQQRHDSPGEAREARGQPQRRGHVVRGLEDLTRQRVVDLVDRDQVTGHAGDICPLTGEREARLAACDGRLRHPLRERLAPASSASNCCLRGRPPP